MNGWVGRITTTGVVTTIATGLNNPNVITSGPDGNLWFVAGTSIWRMTTAGARTKFTDQRIFGTEGIAVGPDGALWFTTGFPGFAIGRVTMTGALSFSSLPDGGWPVGISAGPDGNMWFVDYRNAITHVGTAPIAPASPSNVTGSPGNASAAVSRTAGSDGGATPTAYTVTASPGGASCVWSSGPFSCVVPGLTNNASYTFTVTATAVKFGTTPAASFTVVDDGTIRAVSPARALGLVNVFVTVPSATSAGGSPSWFQYVSGPTAAPTISGMTPNIGPVGGGTSMTMSGTGFLSVSAVRFGPSTPASFSVINDTTLQILSPPHAASLVNVWVTNHLGTSVSAAPSWFSYKVITGPAPTITALSKNNGPVTGGTAVTITGTGFTGATLVRFGSTSASFVVVNDTTITTTSPAHAAGLVNVFVSTQNGTSLAVPADQFGFH